MILTFGLISMCVFSAYSFPIIADYCPNDEVTILVIVKSYSRFAQIVISLTRFSHNSKIVSSFAQNSKIIDSLTLLDMFPSITCHVFTVGFRLWALKSETL